MTALDNKYITLEVGEASLRSRNPEMSLLYEVSDLLATPLRVADLMGQCLSKIMAFFEIDAGRIYLLNEEGVQLHLFAHQGIDPRGLERVSIHTGFSGKAIRTRSFIAQHVSELEDKERVDLLTKRGLEIVMCVPLMSRNKVLGVMNLAAKHTIQLDHGKIDLLTTLGNQMAVAVDNAKLYVDLERQLAALSEKKELITFFAYSISHDLKSPATSLYGLASRLINKYASGLDAKGKEHCELILKTAQQILSLVEMINAYIAAKEAPLYLEEVSLGDVVDAIREEFSQQLEARGVQILGSEALPSVVADRMGMTRIFRNLVDNALKYGGDALSEIRLECRDNGAFYVLSITDDGVGLPDGGSERLFELFQRRLNSNKVAGTGMGLAIVKEMVRRHGGHIWLDPDYREGARFYLTLCSDLKPGPSDTPLPDMQEKSILGEGKEVP
ncbi:MAG: GAF domain-containing protein [Deltaproteobacteria bacterium]|nr:GAF domain-containing protein [Deltaproteobacteria bacterium]